jgi:hypothetical protein
VIAALPAAGGLKVDCVRGSERFEHHVHSPVMSDLSTRHADLIL